MLLLSGISVISFLDSIKGSSFLPKVLNEDVTNMVNKLLRVSPVCTTSKPSNTV